MLITLTEFKTDIYSRDVQLPELPSDASFFSLLKRAIVNVRAELKSFEPDKFEGWLTAQTSPVTYPTDLVQDDTTLFYQKDEYSVPFGTQYVHSRGGAWYVDTYTDFNIKYQKDIPVHTLMTENLTFTMQKSQEILISEMMALINEVFEENEATAAVTNALTQSNRVS